jgi:phosphate uptake regulator
MKRRVIRQANQAHTITLPIEWVRKHGIKAGTELDVNVAEKALVISTQQPVKGGSVKIDVSGLHAKVIFQHVNSLYSRGVDEIAIKSDKDVSGVLLKVLQQTIGYALVAQSKNTYVIRDVSGGTGQDIDEVCKRAFQVILQFFDAAIADLSAGAKTAEEEIRSRDIEVNKLTLFLQRAINKSALSDAIEGRTLFALSFMLERIGDDILRTWRNGADKQVRITPAIVDLLKLCQSCLEKAFALHYQYNPARIIEVYNIRDNAREKAGKLNLDGRTAQLIRYTLSVAEDAADITQLTVMRRLK